MGAEDEDRTRDLQLGKLPLYQLSYFRGISAIKPVCKCKGETLMPKNIFISPGPLCNHEDV